MDYEQRYNAALQRAKKLQETCDSTAVVGWCEYIFPELQESEDEKIRKELMDFIYVTCFPVKDLKKKERFLDWLEKQGEQKSSDKVEPKFKVGDWIVLPLGIIAHIDSLNSTNYQVTTTDGKICDFKISKQDNYHLWSIHDAKGGDVLFHSDSASNGIFIFKEILQRGTIQKVVCYCDYDSEDGFCLGENHTCCWTNSKILHPATKEQRDLLFQKMADAGYEFVNGHITRF